MSPWTVVVVGPVLAVADLLAVVWEKAVELRRGR